MKKEIDVGEKVKNSSYSLKKYNQDNLRNGE